MAVASTSTLNNTSTSNSNNDELETLTKLILAQAVAQVGSTNWNHVHNLINQNTSIDAHRAYTPEDWAKTYQHLLNIEGWSLAKTALPKARTSRKLAHKYYKLHLEELVKKIAKSWAEEDSLRLSITSILSGSHDSQILASVPAELRHEVVLHPPPSPPPADNGDDEDDDGEGEEIKPLLMRDRDRERDRESTAGESEMGGDEEEGGRKRKGKSAASSSKTRKSKRKSPEAAESPPASRKRIKTEDLTEEEAAKLEKAEKDEKATALRFKRAILQLLDTLQQEKHAHQFNNPVSKKDAASYYDAVKRPMCITDVIRRVKNGATVTSQEVMRDAAVIFANAVQFNGVNEEVGVNAREIWGKFEELMTLHMSTEFMQ
ncbi:Bromodomain-containing protein [Meredithblackwellia eburnea MCA 4105]